MTKRAILRARILSKLRTFWQSFKVKTKNRWKWLRKNVINKEMFFWVIIAELIFWSPCIVTAALAVFHSKYWWTVFGSVIAFWSGPFTPAIPLQLGLALVLKKIFSICKRKEKDDK